MIILIFPSVLSTSWWFIYLHCSHIFYSSSISFINSHFDLTCLVRYLSVLVTGAYVKMGRTVVLLVYVCASIWFCTGIYLLLLLSIVLLLPSLYLCCLLPSSIGLNVIFCFIIFFNFSLHTISLDFYLLPYILLGLNNITMLKFFDVRLKVRRCLLFVLNIASFV